ncbi:TPM domain-containing protein [Psychroserpens luteolus]|uniref:TPM domain-containing protein n=1 Tax=Psychroserpens luteolus TaxID=2855840 RepID=UPI001E518984|nr:TPM domain-containing protein [Psychroserpens luteolus]MCD2260178.1 TPM domain-containing protein [Psychroserpens luteolus]
MKKIAFILVIIFSFSCKTEPGVAVDYSLLPKNETHKVVLDLSQVFNTFQIDELSKKIIDYEQQTTNEIVVLTVDSISPFDDIHTYSSAIGDYWGVGKKDKDNGLVIVLRKNQKHIWLSTGDGTSKILTDSICQDIIDNTMIPYFKDGNYYLGIYEGLDRIMKTWH